MRLSGNTCAFNYLSFSNTSYLMELGSKTWLLRIYKDHVVFNENQNVLDTYNHTLMKSALEMNSESSLGIVEL